MNLRKKISNEPFCITHRNEETGANPIFECSNSLIVRSPLYKIYEYFEDKLYDLLDRFYSRRKKQK